MKFTISVRSHLGHPGSKRDQFRWKKPVSIKMKGWEVTTETKLLWERLSELNCFLSYSPGQAKTHTQSQPPKWAQRGPKQQRPHSLANAKPQGRGKGAAGGDREYQAKHRDTGIPEWNTTGCANMLFLLWWSTEVKCNYSQWRALTTPEPSEQASFQEKQKSEFAFFFVLVLTSFYFFSLFI